MKNNNKKAYSNSFENRSTPPAPQHDVAVAGVLGSVHKWFVRLFMVPFLVIGAFSIPMMLYSWAMLFPSHTKGTVVGHEQKWDDEDRKNSYFVKYEFERNGVREHSRACVSSDSYASLHDGDTVEVIYTPFVANSGADLDLPERRVMGYIFAPFMTVWAVGWNGISWGMFLSTFAMGRKRSGNPESLNRPGLSHRL